MGAAAVARLEAGAGLEVFHCSAWGRYALGDSSTWHGGRCGRVACFWSSRGAVVPMREDGGRTYLRTLRGGTLLSRVVWARDGGRFRVEGWTSCPLRLR